MAFNQTTLLSYLMFSQRVDLLVVVFRALRFVILKIPVSVTCAVVAVVVPIDSIVVVVAAIAVGVVVVVVVVVTVAVGPDVFAVVGVVFAVGPVVIFVASAVVFMGISVFVVVIGVPVIVAVIIVGVVDDDVFCVIRSRAVSECVCGVICGRVVLLA